SSLRDKLVARTEELDKIWKKRYLEDDIIGLIYNKEKNKLHILVDFRNKNDDELLNILFEEGDEEELDSELASYAYGIGLHVRTTAFSDDYDGNAPTEDSKLLHKVNPTFTVRILHKKGNGLYEFSIKDTLVDTSSL
ncbi:MAG: hypothetical protein K2J10_07310, partial [Muribaculaceae bacterium]|nr:hypothetical protein [Muribaculaceae bacterium]